MTQKFKTFVNWCRADTPDDAIEAVSTVLRVFIEEAVREFGGPFRVEALSVFPLSFDRKTLLVTMVFRG